MPRFESAREAKEFLIERILCQARRNGVSLSEIEKKMLYFSETDWTLPDMPEINEEFDRHYDQSEYERKIAKLVRGARGRQWQEGHERDWKEAVRVLGKEDHYLLVLIDAAR